MHFHLSGWSYGGIGFVGGLIFRRAFEYMFESLIERFWDRRDDPVWSVIRNPRFRPEHTAGTHTFYTKDELPYSMEELAAETGLSKRSVFNALRRLEKRGKVKEVELGWQRKEK